MARKKQTFSRAEAEKILVAGGRELDPVLRSLPADVDPKVAGPVIGELLEKNWWYTARRCRELPGPVIAAILDRIDARTAAPWPAFVHAHVGATKDLVPAWANALEAVLDLNTTYGFGSKQQIAKLQKVAGDPRGLEAARAVAATRDTKIPWTILAVLFLDGSDESVDAILPMLDHALSEKDSTLDWIVRLERHASTGIKKILELARAAKDEREAASPALDLARHIFGADAPKTLSFTLFLGSVGNNRSGVPRVQAHITIDSDASTPFHVSALAVDDDAISEKLKNALARGTEIPEWLARTAAHHEIAWAWDRARPRTSLRGKRRDQMMAWLRGEGTPPPTTRARAIPRK